MTRTKFDRRAFVGSSAAALMLGAPNGRAVASGAPHRRPTQRSDSVGVDEVSPAFSAEEYEDRLRRVRERMAQDNIDVLWTMMPEGICYLHGMGSLWYQANSPKAWSAASGTAVHVDHDKVIHFDDGYHSHLLEGSPAPLEIEYFRGGDQLEFMIRQLESRGWLGGTIGLEFWSYRPNPAITAHLQEKFRARGCQVVDGSDVLREVRLVKSPPEIAYIEEAARICDIGHEAIRATLAPGVTELEVYGEAVRAMYAAGGETAALIQGIGGGGAHGLPSRRRVRAGETLWVDLSGVVNRYHANALRNYIVGEPTAQMITDYEKSAGSFDVLERTAKPGTPLRDVNDALVDYYKQVGTWGASGWATAYELGISFPPDWVGNFVFNITDPGPSFSGVTADPSEWSIPVGAVTNYESIFQAPLIDTFVYEADGARRLSALPLEIFPV